MRRLAAVLPLAAAALLASPLTALDDDVASPAEIAQRFGRLRTALTAGGGMLEQDRLVVRSLQRDAAEALEAAPGDATLLAVHLQLALWLDEDPDGIAEDFRRLTDARPDDLSLALAQLTWLEGSGQADDVEITARLAELAARFPGERAIADRAQQRQWEALHYAECAALIEAMDLDPNLDAELQIRLARCLYADHRFAAAVTALEAIDQLPPAKFRLRAQIDQLAEEAATAIDHWAAEQAIRAEEASRDDLPRAEIRTAKGTVVVELFEDQAPNTVANFLKLAREDFYVGTAFHRFEPDFVVQGGDVNSKADVEGVPGTGNPGYTIPDEHGEGFQTRRHFRDSLAMARTAAADSAGSQFYFCHRPIPSLDGAYTVFGRVLEGLDVVRSLRANDAIEGVTVLRTREGSTYEPTTIPLEVAAPDEPVGDAGDGGADASDDDDADG